MKISIKSVDPASHKTACLVVGIYEDRKPAPSARAIDKLSGGAIARVLKHGDISGKAGQSLVLHNLPGVAAERVMLVGCGKSGDITDSQYRTLIQSMTQGLNNYSIKDAVCCLAELQLKDRKGAALVQLGSETVVHNLYRYTHTKSENNSKPSLRQLVWHIADKQDHAACSKAASVGQATGNGMALARELGNLPGNICTPSHLASEAKKLGKDYGMKVSVLGEKQMQELKMGALLSVARGSRQPPKLIVMEYNGGKKTEQPIALVGKGITFDSGGISIKPAAAMDEMKFDMCGAASVIGTLRAIAELKLPVNIVGIVPSCENLPDGNANKPGDIVTSMSGQTIEVLNTDAEGRLVLCDALTYSKKFKPRAVIDIATLTGACVIALGKQACGILGNDQKLIDKLLRAGQTSADRGWQLPLWEEYQEQLKSNFADMANIGGREAGTITAACFLSRFAKALTWAHMDIAGVAWDSGNNKGATGRPVPLLVNFLLGEADKA